MDNEYFNIVIVVYLIFHSPAIITLIIGFVKLKKNPITAKKFMIFSGIYFLVGAGLCGAILLH
ncbi:hypothetical protein ACG2LH_16260 [Zhouia sp. PK063]|uniref:hypothetical protein n=1 Tax=Zhouia sp. PK063 TaxID=3373602 RepID=UPI0037A19302